MITPSAITTDNVVFVLLSFEGPDPYAMAGGLGVRITNLARALAEAGYPTHQFFIGDPKRKGEEITAKGKLIMHRWCQWISEYYPNGVYQGENEKAWDFNQSIPRFVTDNIVKPAVSQNKMVVVLGEEWHTAEAMCRLHDRLSAEHLRGNVLMFWNANNTFGFDRIDWKRLVASTTITTVSRYMKHLMQRLDVNALVIPNGIPQSLLGAVDEARAAEFRRHMPADLILTKIARWDPDKRWLETIEATAYLKAQGLRTVLLARGGMESYGGEVLHRAHSLGLTVRDVYSRGNTISDYLEATANAEPADILNIRFHCPIDLLQILYRASDAVLANSGHEPFGIVGLESMASGGITFTGGTGEDYAIHLHNSIVLETPDPREISAYLNYLETHPENKERIRAEGLLTAERFTWEQVINNLIEKLEYQGRIQGLLGASADTAASCTPRICRKAKSESKGNRGRVTASRN